jgi:prevent-host-death family protein
LLYAEAKVVMIMINLKDVESLTAFKRNTTRYVKKIKESGKPLVLTVNGKAEIVVQDAESYRRLLELLDRAETAEAVREGLESVRREKTMSLGRFDRKMRKKISATKKR